MDQTKAPGKIITFYSYKGGTGRSMALANMAWVLACGGKRVLVIDWDLEAPGLHRYFRPFLRDKELTSSRGVIDYVTDFAAEAVTPLGEGEQLTKDWYVERADLLEYVISLNWNFPNGGALDFVPAGQQGPTYTTRFTSFSWQSFYDRLGGGQFLEAAKKLMRAEYDYVLIDSRTGVSDTAGICTVQLPDTLVVCFTYNNQSIEGAAGVTKSIYDQRRGSRETDEYKFQVFPIPMRADPFERNKLERRKRFARLRFDPYIDLLSGNLRSYWGEVEVPYIPYYAYEELLATFRDEPSDVNSILAAIVRITKYVTANDVSEFTQTAAPEARQKVLDEFEETPESAGEGVSTVTGALETPIEKQLRLADAVLAQLTPEEKADAKRLWTRLVRVSRFSEADGHTRLKVRQEDIPEAAQALIGKFAQQQLLVIDRDRETKSKTVEATSEEFLRNWPPLQKWIEEDRKFILWRQHLQELMTPWEVGGDELLHGRPLREAEAWAEKQREDLTGSELEFIKSSRRRVVRRNQRYVVAAVVAVLMLAGYLIFRAVAERRQRTAVAKELLAAQSKLTPTSQSGRLEASTLLALEVLDYASNGSQEYAEAETILRRNLALLPARSTQIKYGGPVVGVALSADGSQLTAISVGLPGGNKASPNFEMNIQVNDSRSGKLIRSYSQTTHVSSSFRLSRDGRYLAIAAPESDDGRTTRAGQSNAADRYGVRFFDIANPGSTVNLGSYEGPLYSPILFSPDSRYLAFVTNDGTAYVADVSAGKALRLARPGANSLLFFKEGAVTRVITLHDDYQVLVWDAATGAPARPPTRLENFGLMTDVTADGKKIAIIQQTDSLQVCELGTNKAAASHALLQGDVINDAEFTRDGKYVVTAGDDATVKVWEVGTDNRQPVSVLAADGKVSEILFSPDKSLMLAVARGEVMRLFNVNDNFKEAAFLIHENAVSDAAFSSDGRFIATASVDNTVRVWNVAAPLGDDLEKEACSRLSRNLTAAEFKQFLPGGEYHATCSNLPSP